MIKNNTTATAVSIYRTPAGSGLVVASGTGLVAHHLPYGTPGPEAALELVGTLYPQVQGESELTREAALLLQRYFAGERIAFDFPLDLHGFTPFQLSVYRVVADIPYGTVFSYGEVASACGSPGAARAIGGAMARNPLPIVIPCHRVVGQSGIMTGFTAPGGVGSKRELLVMEGLVLNGRGGVLRRDSCEVMHRISTTPR